jgi:hypothetical protein
MPESSIDVSDGLISVAWNSLKPGAYQAAAHKLGGRIVPGDADGNRIVDISDAVHLISYIFSGGIPPIIYLSGDADCNQFVDISDAVYLIAYIFQGGPAPLPGCVVP